VYYCIFVIIITIIIGSYSSCVLLYNSCLPMQVAALFKAWTCGRSLAGNVVSNPARARMSCECCALSDKGLCGGPITRPEESYRLYVCVCVCVSLSVISKPRQWGGLGPGGLSNYGNKIVFYRSLLAHCFTLFCVLARSLFFVCVIVLVL
jgi:hypothetical protein